MTPSEDRLGVDFNRPPRLLPAPRERSFTLPAEPAKAADTAPPSQVTGRVEISSAVQSIDDATFAAAPVRVGLLGPVAVRASCPMDED